MDTPSLLRNHISLKQLYSIVVPICKHYRIGTCLYTTFTNLSAKYLVMYKVNTDGGISNSYTMGCPPVRGDNPRALASGLSYVQVDKHGLTILYQIHQCRPCTSSDISC